MLAISEEHVARYESEQRGRHPELARYARLEWGGHTGWLRNLTRSAYRSRVKLARPRGLARFLRPTHPERSPVPSAVLLERVRIQEGFEILISVGLPEVSSAGPLEVPHLVGDSVERELRVLP